MGKDIAMSDEIRMVFNDEPAGAPEPGMIITGVRDGKPVWEMPPKPLEARVSELEGQLKELNNDIEYLRDGGLHTAQGLHEVLKIIEGHGEALKSLAGAQGEIIRLLKRG